MISWSRAGHLVFEKVCVCVRESTCVAGVPLLQFLHMPQLVFALWVQHVGVLSISYCLRRDIIATRGPTAIWQSGLAGYCNGRPAWDKERAGQHEQWGASISTLETFSGSFQQTEARRGEKLTAKCEPIYEAVPFQSERKKGKKMESNDMKADEMSSKHLWPRQKGQKQKAW